jgi:hypothetical protein
MLDPSGLTLKGSFKWESFSKEARREDKRNVQVAWLGLFDFLVYENIYI